MGSRSPIGSGNFFLGGGRPIVKYRDILRSSLQKTAEPIEMPCGLWAGIGPCNYVLDGGPDAAMRRGNFDGERAVGWLEFNVPFQHKYGYIRDEGKGRPIVKYRDALP